MSNRLAKETSPYLRQHADNPVDWYPWGDEAFNRARKENKPIHLSVGYAACHWCHVMAHESFENHDIAQLMNEHFINIKVDRQERPDIDDIYQKVVQMMGQGGGWPLTVFMTPDAEPFFGGTYFPPMEGYGRPGFAQILLTLNDLWLNKRPELDSYIKQFLQGYAKLDANYDKSILSKKHDIPLTAALFFAKNTDVKNGGMKGAPKFPIPACYDLILRTYYRTRNPELLKSLELTLDGMANGGIYDQLGGGFSRYSVDQEWLIPHFEKMLYDNAQLVRLYADTYRLTGHQKWKQIFEETIAYVLRDMTHPGGGFYASEDADSEGEEGTFYVWTSAQVKDLLGESDGARACRFYGITEEGNFEDHKNVLHRPIILNAKEEEQLQKFRETLFAAREKRVRPGRDENILASWNALMIQGLCTAYQATGNTGYIAAARKAADFIAENMTMPDGGVYHVWREEVPKIAGFLDDYSFLANALLDLYESTFVPHYLKRAIHLVDLILDKFWENGFYFTPKDGEQLVHRPRAPYDNACPSGTSTSVFALLRVYELTGKESYLDYANQVLSQYNTAASQNPFNFPHFLAALDFMHSSPVTIVFAGDRSKKSMQELIEVAHRTYLSSRILAFADDVSISEGKEPVKGQATAYICRNRTCEQPLTSPDVLIDRLLKTE